MKKTKTKKARKFAALLTMLSLAVWTLNLSFIGGPLATKV
jgi:hypothetical protein